MTASQVVTGEETPGETGYGESSMCDTCGYAHGNQTYFSRTQHCHLLTQWEKLSRCKHMHGINHEL